MKYWDGQLDSRWLGGFRIVFLEKRKSILKIAILSAALLLPFSSAWAVNKCTSADGKSVFQDAPCMGKGATLDIRSAPPKKGLADSPAPDWKVKAAESDKRSEIQSAVERREAVIGMTIEQLQQAMGLPDRLNTGDYQSGSKDQRIYERSGRTWYVYTAGNLVTAVQTSATVGATSKPTVCPGSLEIRNAETSASSITLSEGMRVEMLRQVREMKNCGR